jgi:type VI secretion system secreted protein VgrG
VGQTAAGKGFGTLNLPRIGQEVIVAFLEGDPDQPIITGVVYNAENMPPYKLPDQRTYSGHIHRSHHGVAKNASEIRFQNQLGSELLLVHAETDSIQQAENNHLMQVGKVHRHEVGQFFHTIVGKPVNVNQAAVAPPHSAAGSGAGGGKPQEKPVEDRSQVATFVSSATGSGAGGGNPPAPPDATTQDPDQLGAFVQIYGDNTTETYGNNSTTITGNDTYTCQGTARTTISDDNHTDIGGTDHYKAGSVLSWVSVGIISYETNLLDVVAEAKLEFSGMIHVDLALAKADGEILSKEGASIKMFTLG